MRPWHRISGALGIGITVRTGTLLQLESAVCRWKLLNAHNVVLQLVVAITVLLTALEVQRTWNINLVDSEFDLEYDAFWVGGCI